MSNATVLIISDEADFSRVVVSRWQLERTVPAFTVMSSQLCAGASAAEYEVAIVGGVEHEKARTMVAALAVSGRPVIFIAGDSATAKSVREEHAKVLVLRNYEGWVDALVVLAGECLRRVDAQTRAERAERKSQSQDRDAALGRYMVEARHGLNNALTSVLGNAELLLLEPGELSPQMRDQMTTIHNMTLRIHEIVQRFSSLEMEMSFGEKESHAETIMQSQLSASGS
jgi:signal transduction histidine kinase